MFQQNNEDEDFMGVYGSVNINLLSVLECLGSFDKLVTTPVC